MKPRKPLAARAAPSYFPADKVVTGWDARHLAGHPELEEYHFIGADFGGADFSGLRFADCRFERCNLSSARVAGTAFQNVAFLECKLLGVQFTACRDLLFGVHFEQCQLRYASFAGRKMPGTRFGRCQLDEADLVGADLSGAVFEGCSLAGAVFENTRLLGADFTTATGFVIDPEINQLQGARFALPGLLGVVAKYGLVVE